MDISGIIQSYDPRATTSAGISRTLIAPHYLPAQAYSGPPTTTMVAAHHQLQHSHNPFTFSAYTGASSNALIPAFANNYIQQRPLPRLLQSENDDTRGMSFGRSTRHGYIEEHQRQSPPIKPEPAWNAPTKSPSFSNTTTTTTTTKIITSTTPTNGTNEVVFGTEVDTLMKAIQAKAQTTPNSPQRTTTAEQTRSVVGLSQTPPYASSQNGGYAAAETSKLKLTHSDQQDEPRSAKSGGKKRYFCTIENCAKSFYQKTHLDIHERAHTGDKPYACKAPGCGRSFSQLGNLKTHERRHTGERPYQCEICGKRFAQRGNVRAHKIVHDASKPYLCRLDECGKQFTQLGNLKSHQNKFHISTIRALTTKFASIKDGDIVHSADKELWEYFANLYKNSNKGIKGRGKDRKVGSSSNSGMRSSLGLGMDGRGGYGVSGSGRGNMGMMGGSHHHHHHVSSHGRGEGQGQQQYEMYDVDDASQSGSGGASSVGTCYDDAPSDGFEDNVRGNELAFGDRIY